MILGLAIQDVHHSCVDGDLFPSSYRLIAALCKNHSAAIEELNMIPEIVNSALTYASATLNNEDPNWMERGIIDDCTRSYRRLDEVLNALGSDLIFPILIQTAQKAKNDDDSKERFKGVIALMAAGEKCKGREEEEQIVHGIIACLNDTNVRVRNHACSALGRMSASCAPLLQEKYHEIIIPALVSSLSDLSVARVAAHAANSLVTFIENCPKHIAAMHFDGMMQSLEEMLRSKYKKLVSERHGMVVGELLDLISSLAMAAPEGGPKFYHQLIIPLKSIISEDISMVMSVITDKIETILDHYTISKFMTRHASMVDLSPYLHVLVPAILRVANGLSMTEKTIDARKTLFVVARAVGDSFDPYVDDVSNLAVLSLTVNDGDSSWALDIAPFLLSAVKPYGLALWLKWWPVLKRGPRKNDWRKWCKAVKECLEHIVECIDEEERSSIENLVKEETECLESEEMTCKSGEEDS